MANGQREYELLFSLQASLGSNFTSTMTAAQKAATTLQSNIKDLNSTNSDITSYTKKAAALESNEAKMKALKDEHKQLQKEINATETPSRSLLTAMERNETQMDRLNATITSQRNGLGELANELRTARVNTDDLTSEQERLNREMQEAIRLQNEYNAIEKAQASNHAAISQTKSQLTTAVGTTVAASAAVYAFAVAPTMEYESQMAVVQSITRATEDEMRLLDATAKEMGQTTAFSAKESAEAMEYLGMAGWSVQQTMEGLPSVLALAAASGGEMGATADIISNGVSAFGLEVSQSGEYADLLAQASRSANTDVALMGETFEKVGSLAGTMGYSVEDLAFATTLMASTGLAGSEAGTQLKSSIANLASPTKAMQTAMNAYGISLTDTEGEMKPFKELIDDMRDSFSALDEAERASAVTTIFGKEAMTGMLTIIDASEEEYERLTEAIYDSTGAAQEMADIRLDTLEGDMQLMKSATESLQLALGEALLPTIREITQNITEAMVKMAQWASENQDLVLTIVKVGAGLSALVMGILSAKLVVLQLHGAFLAVKKAMLMAQIGQGNLLATLTKMSPVLVILAAVGAGFYLISNHLEEVRGWIEKTFGSEALGRFDTFLSHIRNIGTVIKSVFSGDLETAKQQMEDAFGVGGLIVFETFETAINSIKVAFTTLGTQAMGFIGAILPLFAQLGSALIPVIAEVINTLVPIIGGLGVAFVTIAGEVIPFFIQAVSFVAFVLTDLIGWISMIIEAISTFMSENSELVNVIIRIVTALGSLLVVFKLLLPVASGIVSAFGMVGKGISAIGSAFLAVNPILAWIAAIVAVGGAIYYVCTHLEEVRGWIENAFGSEALAYFDGFVAMVQWLGDCIGNGVTIAIQSFIDFGEGLIQFVTSSINVLAQLGEYLMFALVVTWETAWAMITGSFEVFKAALSVAVSGLIAILNGILEFLSGVFVGAWSVAWELIQTLFGGVLDAIGIYIETYKAVLDGLIQFITGVFTGNWSQAWEGIKSIFSGVFEGIRNICSSVMNTIVGAINTVIGGLNGLSIPDWVPGVGGMSLSIPLIPQFAKGTNYTPDTFIAGEEGAELITGGAGRKVFTAVQTGEIFTNLHKAQQMIDETQSISSSEVQTIVMVAPWLQQALESKGNKQDDHNTRLETVSYVTSMLPVMTHAIANRETMEGMGGNTNVQAESLSPSLVYSTTETRGHSVVIHSSPVIHVGSTAEAKEVQEVLRQHDIELQEDWKRQLEELEEDKKRRGYD